MARKRRRGGFGEAAGKHKEAFEASDSIAGGVAGTLADARRFMDEGRCADALSYMLSAEGTITAMTAHSHGFRATANQRAALKRYRDTLWDDLQKRFRGRCLCGK